MTSFYVFYFFPGLRLNSFNDNGQEVLWKQKFENYLYFAIGLFSKNSYLRKRNCKKSSIPLGTCLAGNMK
jgi:hypothetical protein